MKALFLGLGGVGQRHLRNLIKIEPDSEIGAVRYGNRTFEIKEDLSTDKSVNIINKYRIRNFKDLDEAVSWKPDLAIISTPSHYHISPATILIQNNIPVLLEKPISHNWDGLDQLVDSAKCSDAFIMIAYMLRFHPGFQQLMDSIKGERLGKIYSAQLTLCSHMPSWHPYEKYTDFYAGRRDYGGGVILTGIHPIDLIYALFGLPVSLYSIGGKVSVYDIDVEDTVITLFDYDLAGEKFPISLSMSFVERPLEHSISIWGEKGQLYWNENPGYYRLTNEDTGDIVEHENKDFERNDMFISEMEHFLDCVELKKRPITDLLDVIEGHKMALYMKESLEKKEKMLL